MKIRQQLFGLMLGAGLLFGLESCKKKPAESDVKSSVEQAAGTAVSVDVDGNNVTLSGTVADDAAKMAAENAAKSVEGVESVTNNITVTPPPPVAPMPSANDQAMQSSVSAAVSKYPGVTATVMDSVITLTGTVAKKDLRNLMQELNAMKPKRIDNKLTEN